MIISNVSYEQLIAKSYPHYVDKYVYNYAIVYNLCKISV